MLCYLSFQVCSLFLQSNSTSFLLIVPSLIRTVFCFYMFEIFVIDMVSFESIEPRLLIMVRERLYWLGVAVIMERF